METVIGFVVGYLVGASEGQAGLARLKASVSAIAASGEVRRLLGEAVAVAEPLARRATSSGGLAGLGGTVIRQFAGASEDRRAA